VVCVVCMWCGIVYTFTYLVAHMFTLHLHIYVYCNYYNYCILLILLYVFTYIFMYFCIVCVCAYVYRRNSIPIVCMHASRPDLVRVVVVMAIYWSLVSWSFILRKCATKERRRNNYNNI